MFFKYFRIKKDDAYSQKAWYYLGGGIGFISSLLFPWINSWNDGTSISIIIFLSYLFCMNQRVCKVYRDDYYDTKQNSSMNNVSYVQQVKRWWFLARIGRVLVVLGLSIILFVLGIGYLHTLGW
jgi:hypothetical protein